MSLKMDRQGVRTPAELERKYNFEKRFDNAMEAAEEASKAVDNLDMALNQAEVFNRLTNGGKSQGVYMGDDGNLYINASYLVTGILQSMDKKTFYLDLVNGVLKGQFTEFSISGKTVEEIAVEKADKAQQNAEEYADEAASNAVGSQTQTDVFNKLTNNGNAEGIYFVNGQLYINASYLAAGILKSLDASTFYLDIANNVLKGKFSEISIGGKTCSWQENDDGTFTLVGT